MDHKLPSTESENRSRASAAAPVTLAETHSLTEVRGEVSDPDRGTLLAETFSITDVRGEVRDPDAGAFRGLLDWERGDRRPLLFRDAVTVTDRIADINYDDAIDMAVDGMGHPVLTSPILMETMTKTAVAEEISDNDH
jgi:hypothetical protein